MGGYLTERKVAFGMVEAAERRQIRGHVNRMHDHAQLAGVLLVRA